jgi:hypothetical protein
MEDRNGKEEKEKERGELGGVESVQTVVGAVVVPAAALT